MKSIRILDKDVNLLGEIDDYEEFKLIRRFTGLSEFEMKIKANSIHSIHIDKLVKNNLLLIGKDYNKVCIILHREYAGDDKVGDSLLVKGVSLQGLINRRLIIPDLKQDFESFSGKQETIIKNFIDKNCINPRDTKRKIDRLALAEDKKRGKEDFWRSSYENLSDKVKEICEFANFGWNVSLDLKEKKFIFDILEGKDLTVNQTKNPPVIFRNDFNNITTRKYLESIINSKNVIYSGTKEDGSKMVLSKGEVSGFERIETFNSVNSDEVNELKKECEIKLEELKEIKTFELDVNPNNTFIYELDYGLGDIVTIQDRKLKITMDSRIVSIEEYYKKCSLSHLKITFGSSIPTILNTIKKIERKVI